MQQYRINGRLLVCFGFHHSPHLARSIGMTEAFTAGLNVTSLGIQVSVDRNRTHHVDCLDDVY